MTLTQHSELNRWIDEMAAMCGPDNIVLIDGSEEQKKALTDEAVSTGEVIRLNEEILPGCIYTRTAQNDVARVEHLTFICTEIKDDAGPNNNWMAPNDCRKLSKELNSLTG